LLSTCLLVLSTSCAPRHSKDARPEEPGPAHNAGPGRNEKDSAWHVGERVGVRTGATALTLVEDGDLFHIAGLDLEVE
jgi:hypothetical protein